MIQPTKEDVLQALISSGYDIMAGWAPTADDPLEFVKRFIYEVARNELYILSTEFSVEIPHYIHPISAIKSYRSIMCNATMYSSAGEVKPQVGKKGGIELRHWKCRYHKKCARCEMPICIRSYAIGFAIDVMSNGKFERVKKVAFRDEGKCVSTLDVQYVGDIAYIPPDEVTVDERTQKIMTREQAIDFGIKVWVLGIESAVMKLIPEHAVEVLGKAFMSIGSDDMTEEEMEVIDLYIGAPISRWTKGLCVYPVNGPKPEAAESKKTNPKPEDKGEEYVIESTQK